jgi:hypothetical protein
VFNTRLSAEPAVFAASYEWPRGGAFDIGGGWMFSDILGVGLDLAGTAHTGSAGVAITIPHPTVFNRPALDADALSGLDRAESSFNFQLMVKAPIDNDKVRLRVFGGPSYFTATMDMVQDIRYAQVFSSFFGTNSVSITTAPLEEVEGSGWGFHAGGDLSYMFTRVFGLGMQARVSRGTVRVDSSNIFTTGVDDQEVKVGGFQLSGGIRLRF